jgi:GGDEF domain-containing protein
VKRGGNVRFRFRPGLNIERFGTSIRMTSSIGVATSDTLGVWGEEPSARADSAVYAAKSGGRNQLQSVALAVA